MTSKSFCLCQRLALTIAVLLLAGCIAPPIPAPQNAAGATPPPRDTLKVGVFPFISNLALVIAQEEGYFSAQNLDVEFVELRSNNEAIPLLLAGEIDVAGPGSNAALFNAIAQGGPLRFVLPVTALEVQECASIGFLARSEDVAAGRYAAPSQWRAANVALPSAGSPGVPGYVLDQALRLGGLTLDDVNLVPVEVPVQAEALRSGQIDLVFAIEPWITRMTADDDIDLLMAAEPFAPDLTASLITYGAKPLANRELGQRFAVAYLQAARQYREGKTPRNIELAATHTGLDPELIKQLCWSSIPTDTSINVDSIMDYQTWIADQGLLDRIVPPAEFLDTSYGAEAKRLLEKAAP